VRDQSCNSICLNGPEADTQNLNPNFVFKSGWAGQASDFEPLKQALKKLIPEAVFSDWQQEESKPQTCVQPCIAIGHSLGFADLISSSQTWQGAISLQGFTHFRSAAVDSCTGTPSRLLRQMQKRFSESPEKVVREFLNSAGFTDSELWPAEFALDQLSDAATQVLSEDLQRLYELNMSLPTGMNILAIATQDDPIVPASLTEYCFRGKTGVVLHWLSDGHRHAVHKHQAQACANLIANWLHT